MPIGCCHFRNCSLKPCAVEVLAPAHPRVDVGLEGQPTIRRLQTSIGSGFRPITDVELPCALDPRLGRFIVWSDKGQTQIARKKDVRATCEADITELGSQAIDDLTRGVRLELSGFTKETRSVWRGLCVWGGVICAGRGSIPIVTTTSC